MSLSERLDQSLQPGRVRVEQDGRSAEVEVIEVERLGLRLRSLKVSGPSCPVKDLAERLPEVLRPLPERLLPVEVDPVLGGAVLRSDPRDMRNRDYFEVRSGDHSVELERWKGTDQGRESQDFVLTREQLGRVVDGLGEALEDQTRPPTTG